MMTNTAESLPTASDCRHYLEAVEAEKTAEARRKHTAIAEEKKALCERLGKPSGVSDEERLKRATAIIRRAVSNGMTEVEVGRFPNILFADLGRAINQQEPGWEGTLTGVPKELFEFWQKHLQPRGYRLKVQIVDWPNGMPGDIGLTLSWGERKKS